MNTARAGHDTAWSLALQAAALFAVDPVGTGGIVVRGFAGPVRDRWLALLRGLLPPTLPQRQLPGHITEDRLLGGLELAATLRQGRPVAQQGVLVEADGGVLFAPMAERLPRMTLAQLTACIDAGGVRLERDGLTRFWPSRFGVVACDESLDDEAPVAEALADRLAFVVDLRAIPVADLDDDAAERAAVAAARARLARVSSNEQGVPALCVAAARLGIESLRTPWLALQAARAAAALAGRDRVGASDLTLAASLVLAPRACVAPPLDAATQAEHEPPPPLQQAPRSDDDASADAPQPAAGDLDQLVLDAARAALPAGLLDQLAPARSMRSSAAQTGRSGAAQRARTRGRPIGTRPGDPRRGARLSLIETLRAAAPWQRLRRGMATDRRGGLRRLEIRPEDFRIRRFRHARRTTTIFVVDASGSAAMHRLAEAKGAVELLLAQCYVRRDRVALIAFRGRSAELLLPPTRSLTRAKRALAGLPGGGGTPLASGIDAALVVAQGVRRAGETALVVVLTDGRVNVARDGKGDRARAEQDALGAARMLRAAQVAALLVDTSPRREPFAERLAGELDARYLPLPHVEAGQLAREVNAQVRAADAGAA